jgi:diguanylate cyclase (GGDEF)-like protein
LVNRRYLERRFAEEIGRFSRDGAVFAAAFMDVDHFKRANDQFGHEAGDAVLQTVARTLANNRRVGDVVGRWGGDEFVALLPQTDGPAAVHVAQRLRILVERSQTKWNGTILPVTISVGITTVRPGDNSETLLDRVDQLMYRSKQGGRNRVTSQF